MLAHGVKRHRESALGGLSGELAFDVGAQGRCTRRRSRKSGWAVRSSAETTGYFHRRLADAAGEGADGHPR